MKTAYEKLTASESGRRAFYEHKAITNVTETICDVMKQDGISWAELAKRLDVTPGRISQILDGKTDLKVTTAARVLLALGRTLEVSERREGEGTARCDEFPVTADAAGVTCWPTIGCGADVSAVQLVCKALRYLYKVATTLPRIRTLPTEWALTRSTKGTCLSCERWSGEKTLPGLTIMRGAEDYG